MSRRSLGLPITIALAIATILAVVVGWETLLPVRLVAIPFALVLPGYTLTAALFGSRALSHLEHLLFSVGLSFTITIIIGFALNWSPWGLQARPWLLLLAGVTLIGGVATIVRRRLIPTEPHPTVHLEMSRRQLLLLGLAGVITIGAVTVARSGAFQQNQATARTQLWILPAQEPNTLQIGLRSQELGTTSFRVQLTLNGDVIQEWTAIELAPDGLWEMTETLPTTQPTDVVEALLYRADDPNTVYRRGTFRPDSTS